ncbi:MAG: hypothetical protein MR274_06095 [Clostridium sp.]|nr:hypothetical protein [Clostridium sp.]MDY3828555.1 hypothetical protein [Clostridium sp.]
MPAGNGVNCPDCPDYKNKKCSGKDMQCLCYRCPRRLAQCICVKYCRETESTLYFDED